MDAESHVQAVVPENGNKAVRLAVRRHQVVSSPLDVVQSCRPTADEVWQRNTIWQLLKLRHALQVSSRCVARMLLSLKCPQGQPETTT